MAFAGHPLRLIGLYGPLKKTVGGTRPLRVFWETVLAAAAARQHEAYLLVGDWNVGRSFVDAPKALNFSAEFEALPSHGWADAWRALHGDAREFSWLSHRRTPYRLDHVFATTAALPGVTACWYSDAERMDATSDHAVMLADIDLGRVEATEPGSPPSSLSLGAAVAVKGAAAGPHTADPAASSRASSAPSEAPVYAEKGSRRWLQVAVNQAPETISGPLRAALALPADAPVTWLSPLAAERFVEYRDQAWVDRLGLALARRPLADFWPFGGPVWDGLARAGDTVLLVEAKAHIAELLSSPVRASNPGARERILASLGDVQASLTRGRLSWNGPFYQYANRVAHLHFLREENGIDAHLVYVYCLNAPDVRGPTTRDEWAGAIQLVEAYLGVGRHRLSRFIHRIYVDVAQLPPVDPVTARS